MSQMKLSTLLFLTVASLSASLQAAPQAQKSAFLFPPPQNMLSRAEPMQSTQAAPTATQSMTLVDIITSHPSFSMLAKAIQSTGLTSTLKGEGPFTLFAPNDLAFAKLSPNALADLMKPENRDKLIAILNYHIIPGRFATADLKSGPTKTVNGKSLTIKTNAKGDVTVNNAKIIKKDLAGSNGEIQVIDTVLIP
jgi:uncharacterized surface protein with fasciclin (FAS1) repeats